VDGLLPRFLRNPDLLAQIRGLDAMHEQERRAGSIVIEIHYDGEGTPKRAWVQARVEIDLSEGL
jgi:hypothetical protein